MISFVLGVLVVGALISVIYGQKAGQGFVTGVAKGCLFLVMVALMVVGLFVYDAHRDAAKVRETAQAKEAAHQAYRDNPQANARMAKTIRCPTCHGTGRDMCIDCAGAGTVPFSEHEIIGTAPDGGPMFRDRPLTCPKCGGSGAVVCAYCGGKGEATVWADAYPNEPAVR